MMLLDLPDDVIGLIIKEYRTQLQMRMQKHLKKGMHASLVKVMVEFKRIVDSIKFDSAALSTDGTGVQSLGGLVELPVGTTIGTVSSGEISHLSGVTSAIQTQLDGKIVDSSFLMKTKLGSDFTTPNQVPQGFVFVPGMVEEYNGINVFYGTWDASNNKWTCPAGGTGFYNVNCLVDIRGQQTDVLREARVRISVTATNGVRRTIADGGCDNGGQIGSEQDRRWVNVYGLDRILAGESIDILVNWTVQPNSNLPEGIIIGTGTNLVVSRAFYP